MPKPKGGLGRGLYALIPSSSSSPQLDAIDIDAIYPNPYQPRLSHDALALSELSDSIRQHGVLQPLVVTQTDRGYQLIAGERRWQAARMAGLAQVPVVIKEVTPQQALELALVENIQRSDLNALEEAEAYRQLVDEFGLSQAEVADRVGRSRVAVANTLRLLSLSADMKKSLIEGKITAGHARALLGLPEEEVRRRLWERVVQKGLSVRQTEEAVRRLLGQEGSPRRKTPALTADTKHLEDEFRAALGTKVNLTRTRKGGKLVIYFYNEEELEGIYRTIVR